MKLAQAATHLLGSAFVFAVSLVSSHAAAIDRLQGAWGVEGLSCEDIFTTHNGRPAFVEHEGEELSGFIVEGRHIKSAGATCEFISSQEKADGITYQLSCNAGIIADKTSISVRFPDANTLVRFDRDFPDIETVYHRCPQ